MTRSSLRTLIAAVAIAFVGAAVACSSDDGSIDAVAACGATGQYVCRTNCKRPYPFAPPKCDLYCTDLETDSDNCGSCDHVCPPAQTCVSGTCRVACPLGDSPCPDDAGTMRCVNTNTDDHSCGACGHECKPGWVCENGTCLSSCGNVSSGLRLCNSADGTPFCAHIETDTRNCGKCGAACRHNQDCVGGFCVHGVCPPGQIECVDQTNGSVCVDFQTDNANCGKCFYQCPPLQACIAGACTNACGSDHTPCAVDGGAPYCANLAFDNTNCGSCGTVCSGAKPVCDQGTCDDGLCRRTALVVADGTPNSLNGYSQALKAAGFVKVVDVAFSTYFGAPDASTFGVVIVSSGTNGQIDMPTGGQGSIVKAQSLGVGVVFTEWASVITLSNGFTKLASLLLLPPGGGQAGQPLTFTLQAPNHPLWNGLPNTFTTTTGLGTVFAASPQNGGLSIASTQYGVGVAALDPKEGRVVHLAFSPNWNNQPWYNDLNLVRLVGNSASWAARCP